MLIYIQKSADTGRAHEHTGFWFIYGCAYENPVLWCLISTLIYIYRNPLILVVLMSILDFGSYMGVREHLIVVSYVWF